MIIVLLLVALTITVIPGEAQQTGLSSGSINPTAVTVTIDTLQQIACFCNLNANLCDIGCCCDPDCDSTTITYFKTYMLCKSNSTTYYPIPSCSDGYTYTASDLQLGLNLYYFIAKQLLCVYGNRTNSTSVFDTGATAAQVAEVETRTAIQANQTVAGLTNYIYSGITVNSQTVYQKWLIPRQGYFSNQCQDTPVNVYQRLDFEPCKRVVTTNLSSWCTTGTFADPLVYTSIGFRNGSSGNVVANLRLRNIYMNAFDGSAYTTVTTLPVISDSVNGTTCVCSNPIVEAHYYIQSYNSTPDFIIDAYVDVVLAEEISGTCDVNFTFTQAFTVAFYETTPNVKTSPLYYFGDPLLFGTIVSGNGTNGTVQAIQVSDYPIPLNMIDNTGVCMQESNGQTLSYDADPSTLTLGENAVFTCSIPLDLSALSTYCQKSTMYSQKQFLNVVDYVHYFAYFANSNPYYISDWFEAANTLNQTTLPSAVWDDAAGQCTFSWPYINIYYSKIGTVGNPGYMINYAEFSLESGTQTFTHSLYVSYISLNQTSEFYISPAPEGRVYLPNDVMYPLYVAAGSKVQVLLEMLGFFMFIVIAKVF